jgi:uncharacterized protein (DUF58 family)
VTDVADPGRKAFRKGLLPTRKTGPDYLDLPDRAPDEPTEFDTKSGWVPSRAFGRMVLLTGLLLVAAIFLRRPDLVVIAAPLAIGAALGLWRRPRSAPSVRVTTPTPAVSEGADLGASMEITNHDPIRYDLVVARLRHGRWLEINHAGRPYAVALPAGETVGVDLGGRALRWGRHSLGPTVAYAVAGDGLLISPAGVAPYANIRAFPNTETFRATDSMPRAAGMIGFHRSRRPGEGGEMAGVRPFSPGDRLRRIDWRVSLRARELHVVATLSDRDAEVTILLDLLQEAGASGGLDGARSVLDVTVRAAAGIAEHYVTRGDRVGFVEYGWPGRKLRASSGRRHFLTILEWLLDTQPSPEGREPTVYTFGADRIKANALTIVLTPLIDPRSVAMLARLARGGRFVVAVDTAPPELLATLARTPRRRDWLAEGAFTRVAARLWLAERENTIAELREHGVPVVVWGGVGSLDEVLAQVSRMASGPQMVVR